MKTEIEFSGDRKGVYDKLFPIDDYISFRVRRASPTSSLLLETCAVLGIDIIKKIDCQQRMALGVFSDIVHQAMYRFKESDTIVRTMFAYVTNKSESVLQIISLPLTDQPSVPVTTSL